MRLVFWRDLSVSGGLFTAAMAQATFIASYAMLMFMARLQRQDVTLEEAAMDLGSSVNLMRTSLQSPRKSISQAAS